MGKEVKAEWVVQQDKGKNVVSHPAFSGSHINNSTAGVSIMFSILENVAEESDQLPSPLMDKAQEGSKSGQSCFPYQCMQNDKILSLHSFPIDVCVEGDSHSLRGNSSNPLVLEQVKAKPRERKPKVLAQMSYCQESFYVSVVYGSNSPTVRRRLWSNLRNLKYMVDDKPWINLADFNVVRHFSERLDGIVGIQVQLVVLTIVSMILMLLKLLLKVPGLHGLVLQFKLKRLKPILRKLNRANFSDISKRLAEAKANLEQFQSQNTDIILSDNIVKVGSELLS
ncbi:hypothetical protein ACSBR2_033087 [Camellia fascicularis]